MDATKKSASQIKREASQEKRESGKRKSVGSAGGAAGNKRPRFNSDNRTPNNRTANNRNSTKNIRHPNSTGERDGEVGTRSDRFPPKQKKKIDKPKHLKRKLQKAEVEAGAAEGAGAAALLVLQQEQAQLEQKKAEAKDKFYQLCRTLVGEDKWDAEKQAVYDSLVKEKGCEKKKFLAALGVEEAKEKVKHRPARDGAKRKKISRAKKGAAQQQKQAHHKNKLGVVIGVGSQRGGGATAGKKAD